MRNTDHEFRCFHKLGSPYMVDQTILNRGCRWHHCNVVFIYIYLCTTCFISAKVSIPSVEMCIRNNFLWYASKYLMTVRWLLNGPSWSWWYVSWIYNYLLCNQCLPPIKLWVRTRSWRGVLDTTLCDKVCKWLATGLWFPPVTPVSSTNKTDRHEITEILLKVTVNTISHPNSYINEN
jgi:hypothetical protein